MTQGRAVIAEGHALISNGALKYFWAYISERGTILKWKTTDTLTQGLLEHELWWSWCSISRSEEKADTFDIGALIKI